MRYVIALITAAAFALPLSAQDRAIERVITSQISAFLEDDFSTAFSHAAPSIRRLFHTPERFGQMVAGGYPMVHRPSDFEFQDLEEINNLLIQRVLIKDQKGDFYIANYSMEETQEGWKINAVWVEEAPGVGV